MGDARPQLNGQAGQILGFHAAQSRWLVSLDDGSKKLVLSANLSPEASQIASRTSVENIGAAPSPLTENGKKSEALSIVSAAAAPCVPPQDLLMAELLSSRLQAMRRVDEISGETGCQVGQAVLSSMQRLFETSVEPTAALRSAETEQLANIDRMMNTLSAFRNETAALFEEYSQKVAVDRQATQNIISSLASSIEPVNKFMQCFAQEVQHESSAANSLHQEQLQHLEKDEADHVAANGDPEQNPVFAQVQTDLAAVKRLLEEQASNDASHSSFMQSWANMWKLLPCRKVAVEADPPQRGTKRGLWGRFWG